MKSFDALEMKGMPIELVSKMLGHNNISTTQIYLDIAERDLEQAHQRYVTRGGRNAIK